MKVLFFNLLKGIPELEREERCIAFLRKQNIDICGLAELNGWEDGNRLSIFARRAGFNYSVLGKSRQSNYHVGLLAKYPLKPRVVTANLRNAILHADISLPKRKVSLVILHLHPKGEDERLQEWQAIRPEVGREGTLLLGDFNALSPMDQYPLNLLSDFQEKGLTKFGTTFLRRELIQQIINDGFVDTLGVFSQRMIPTIPTPLNVDQDHCAPLRLDYIFCSRDIQQFLLSASVIRTTETDFLSDHYPVLAEFSFHNH